MLEYIITKKFKNGIFKILSSRFLEFITIKVKIVDKDNTGRIRVIDHRSKINLEIIGIEGKKGIRDFITSQLAVSSVI